MKEVLEDWFAREILSHEAALTRYIKRICLNVADVRDIRHDIYIRIIEAARIARPLSAKSFLFTTARNLLSDRARRDRIVSIALLEDLDALNVLIDEVSPERTMHARQQLSKLADAFECMPDRCRETLWLKKVEGLSQKDIARRLKIAEGTVEGHLVRGMKLLTQLFYGERPLKGSVAPQSIPDQEMDHGQ